MNLPWAEVSERWMISEVARAAGTGRAERAARPPRRSWTAREITRTQCVQCYSEIAGVNGRWPAGICGCVSVDGGSQTTAHRGGRLPGAGESRRGDPPGISGSGGRVGCGDRRAGPGLRLRRGTSRAAHPPDSRSGLDTDPSVLLPTRRGGGDPAAARYAARHGRASQGRHGMEWIAAEAGAPAPRTPRQARPRRSGHACAGSPSRRAVGRPGARARPAAVRAPPSVYGRVPAAPAQVAPPGV